MSGLIEPAALPGNLRPTCDGAAYEFDFWFSPEVRAASESSGLEDQVDIFYLSDNTQFAVKHQGATVLTVNKDLTTLRKTEVTDELTIGKGKFVPKTNGLDFVLLD